MEKKYKEVISDILDHISPFVGLCYGVGFDAGESSKDCIMKLSQKIHQIVTETENRYESDGVSNIFESQIVLNKLIEAEMWAEKIEDYPTINNKRYPKA